MREADNTISFTFDGKNAVDLNAIQAAIDPVAEIQTEATSEVTPTTEVEVPGQITQPEAKQTEVPSAQKSESQPEELKTYKITVDGQEMEVTEADLKAGHMRHRDYTQKTQRVAEKERQLLADQQKWEQERVQINTYLNEIDQFLRDQEAIKAYQERAFGYTPSPAAMPQMDPNQPITAAQAAEISRYNAEQVRLTTERQLAEIRQAALDAQNRVTQSQNAVVRERMASEIDTHVSSMLDKYPVLKKFEGIEDELIGEAARYMPTDRKGTLEDAKARLSEAAERRMATIRTIAEEEKKQSAIKAAQLKKNSTEAPGGTAPKSPTGRTLSLATKDRKDFLKAAEEDLRALMGKN